MGCYLHIAVCTQIQVKQEYIESKESVLEDLTRRLGKTLDLHLYQFANEGGWLSWYLKKEILEQGLLSYLERQFELFELDTRFTAPIVKELKAKNSWDEILHFARHSNQHENFCYCEDRQHISVGRHNYIPINYQYIQFLSDGKIMLESHQCLTYLERLIQLQQERYPLAGATQVWVQ